MVAVSAASAAGRRSGDRGRDPCQKLTHATQHPLRSQAARPITLRHRMGLRSEVSRCAGPANEPETGSYNLGFLRCIGRPARWEGSRLTGAAFRLLARPWPNSPRCASWLERPPANAAHPPAAASRHRQPGPRVRPWRRPPLREAAAAGPLVRCPRLDVLNRGSAPPRPLQSLGALPWLATPLDDLHPERLCGKRAPR